MMNLMFLSLINISHSNADLECKNGVFYNAVGLLTLLTVYHYNDKNCKLCKNLWPPKILGEFCKAFQL